eukprot:gene9375-19451_t
MNAPVLLGFLDQQARLFDCLLFEFEFTSPLRASAKVLELSDRFETNEPLRERRPDSTLQSIARSTKGEMFISNMRLQHMTDLARPHNDHFTYCTSNLQHIVPDPNLSFIPPHKYIILRKTHTYSSALGDIDGMELGDDEGSALGDIDGMELGDDEGS